MTPSGRRGPPRARPRATRAARARRRGCAPARARRGRTTPTWSAYCPRPSSTEAVQIFVAIVAPSRRPVERGAERPPPRRDTSATSRRAARRPRARRRRPCARVPRRNRTCSTCRARRRARAAAPRSRARRVDERERHVDHRVEVLDGDALVGRVDVGHPVREIHAAPAALVEDVRVGGAARQRVRRRVAAALERGGREPHDVVVLA